MLILNEIAVKMHIRQVILVKIMKIKIPQSVLQVVKKLEENNFEVFIVGGCVRDVLLGRVPKDWDVATSAIPEETQELFSDSVYENQFGTVGVKVQSSKLKVKNENKKPQPKIGLLPEEDKLSLAKKIKTTNKNANIKKEQESAEIVEVTTYRIESKYSDKRHPDEVRFAKTLEEDLSRRDFTINAMALQVKSARAHSAGEKLKVKSSSKNSNSKTELKEDDYELIDPYNGKLDLENTIIQAVGKAEERFNEDALRMMRAVRFAVELDFSIERNTYEAIKRNSKNLGYISQERVRDEFTKIILSSAPTTGISMLMDTGLMQHIMPEILDSVGVKQNRHHYYGPFNTVFKHSLASLEKCPSEKLEVRLASFLHDIGKPKTKEGEGEMATFHAHEYAGANLTKRILERMKYPRKVIDKTVLLVKNHMFYYNVDEVGESGVRRVVHKVGLDNINDLIDVRIADRLGSGVPKAVPYKLRHFKYMVEKVSKDPISVGQLKLKGDELMCELDLEPGPKVGAILEVLLSQIIEDPKLNTKKDLIRLAKKLKKQNLNKLRKMAREKIQQQQQEEEKKMKGKYWVK